MHSAASALLRAIMTDPVTLRRMADINDAMLYESDVADLLGISGDTLKRMIKDGEWIMVRVNGRHCMTRDQFREQRDRLVAIKRRRF